MTYDWWYDDRRQVGLDFEDEVQVQTYDARQGGSAERDRALLLRLGVGSDMVVAAIGCGTGLLACEAARLSRAAIAVDVSAAMLRAVERRAAAMGCMNLSLERAGFLTFAPPEGSLDLVISKNALHHLPDFWKAVALARIHAMLRPGGRFYLRDVMFSGPAAELPAMAEAWIAWLAANTGYAREEGASHVRDEYSTFDWAIDRMLCDSGFQVIEHTQDGVYGTFLAVRR